jgi:cell division protein FtsW
MLLFVLVFGSTFGTIAQNWLVLFNTSLQPSEFAKLAIILYLAYWFSKKQAYIEDFKQGLIPFCIICGIIILPIIMQNDFGGTLTLALIAVSMYFMAGAKLQHIGVLLLFGIIGMLIVILAVPHVRERFQGFTKVDEECVEDYCWQSQQANIAVGSGGAFGKGLTQGVQKSYWLPQASDDFIFAASAEELGFIKIVFVILAYFVIALRGYEIASKSQGSFETLLAIGLTMWITVQAFVNIAVNTGLFPVTGITLPFVSYGGSSLISCLVAVGILLNLSQNTSHHENSINRWGNRRSHYPQYGRYRRN